MLRTPELLAKFFLLSSEVFVVVDSHGRVERANERWRETSGHTIEDSVGREISWFFHPDDVGTALQSLTEPYRDEEAFQFECRIVHREGHPIWLRWRGIADVETGARYLTAKNITAEKTAFENFGRVVTNAFESEQFERILSRIAPVAIFRADARGAVTYVNPVWESLSGMPMEKALGFGWVEAIHPEDREWMPARWAKAIETDTYRPMEYRLQRPDGKTYWMYGSHAPLTDLSGNVVGYVGAALDITIVKENEAKLESQRQLLEAFMKYTPSSMYVKGVDGRLLLANAEYERRFAQYMTELGKPVVSPVGRDISDYMPEDFAKRIRENDREIIERREAKTYEEQIVHSDGSHTYLSAKFPIFGGKGDVVGIGGVSSDVSELVRQRERSELLRQLIETAKDGFGYCDIAGRPVYLNRFLTEELAWTLNDRIDDLLSPATAARCRAEVFPALTERGGHWEGEVEFVNRRTGALVPIWLKIFRPADRNGTGRYFAFFANDVRAKREAEAAILHSSKMASLGQMAAGVAHEVNNPITIIHGTAGLLKRAVQSDDLDRSKLESGLERVEKTAMRISRIVRGLRMFARGGENDPPVSVPLRNIVEETLDVCQERFRDHAIELRVENLPESPIRCRPTQIAQVLLNLLNNSFDAVVGREEKWVAIEFEIDDRKALISVTDSGTGIPPEVARRLMEPFFTTKDPGKGTGLGLPISRGIVEEHGGRLSYDSASPHTRFVMELPLGSRPSTADTETNDVFSVTP